MRFGVQCYPKRIGILFAVDQGINKAVEAQWFLIDQAISSSLL